MCVYVGNMKIFSWEYVNISGEKLKIINFSEVVFFYSSMVPQLAKKCGDFF
jgi:hypothetical protein